MKRIASLIVLFTAALHGQTICSYIGTSTCANTLLTYGPPALPVKLLYNGYNPGTLPPPTQYVTYMQGAAPNVTTPYTTTFQSVAGWGGSISVMADDIVTVSINGTQIGVTKASQYNQVIAFPLSAIITGTNTLTLAVQNTGGNTGVGFYAKIIPPTPPTTATYTFGASCTATGVVGSMTLTMNTGCVLTKVGP